MCTIVRHICKPGTKIKAYKLVRVISSPSVHHAVQSITSILPTLWVKNTIMRAKWFPGRALIPTKFFRGRHIEEGVFHAFPTKRQAFDLIADSIRIPGTRLRVIRVTLSGRTARSINETPGWPTINRTLSVIGTRAVWTGRFIRE